MDKNNQEIEKTALVIVMQIFDIYICEESQARYISLKLTGIEPFPPEKHNNYPGQEFWYFHPNQPFLSNAGFEIGFPRQVCVGRAGDRVHVLFGKAF